MIVCNMNIVFLLPNELFWVLTYVHVWYQIAQFAYIKTFFLLSYPRIIADWHIMLEKQITKY